jgi:hypothetical protein
MVITGGSMVIIGGSMIVVEGTMVVVKGSMIVVEGTMIVVKGSMIVVEGLMIVVKGSMIVVEGPMVVIKGSMIIINGRSAIPQRPIPSAGGPHRPSGPHHRPPERPITRPRGPRTPRFPAFSPGSQAAPATGRCNTMQQAPSAAPDRRAAAAGAGIIGGPSAAEEHMGIVPETRLGRIEFYEAHLGPWDSNDQAIGLQPASVTNLSTLTAAARKAYEAAESAREASKAATRAYHNAVRAMHSGPGAGQDMIDQIRNFAQSSNNPNVYVLAQIPPPATPGTTPPPGTPLDFEVRLLQTGALELRFKCVNPPGTQGTIYEVQRRIGAGAFAFIGASGVRSLIDETLPAGSAQVTYQVTAVRSTLRGDPALFTVSFGTGAAGMTIASITQGDGERLAA